MEATLESARNGDLPEVILIQSTNSVKKTRGEKMRFILVFVGLQISLFLAALDNTILATSLPTIGSYFQAMFISSWIVTSYAMTSVVLQPLFSKFSDIIGRKPVLLFCLADFTIGSALCGVSKTMIMLIIFRAIQGIGAAGIFSLVYVIMSDIIPLEKLGKYQGITTGVFALASITGPLIGGSLTDYVSWRWNFYINLPLGGLAIVIVYLFLDIQVENQSFKDKLMRIDYTGSLLVFMTGTLFLLAMNFGGQSFPWQSAAVIVPLVLSVTFLVMLVVVEMKFAKEPLLPPRLFTNRSVVALLFISLLFGVSYFTAIYYLPMYFQTVRGDSAIRSGIRMLPLEISTNVFAIIFGLSVTKFGVYRLFVIVSMAMLTLSTGLFRFFSTQANWSIIYGITVIAGIGIGAYFAIAIISIQASVEMRDIAVAIGLQRFTMAFGGAIGIAIASATFNSSLRNELPKEVPIEYAEQVFQSPEFIRNGLPQEHFDATVNIFANSIQLVWLIITITAGTAFLSSFIVKAYSLRGNSHGPDTHEGTTSDAQEQQMEYQTNGTYSIQNIELNKEEHAAGTISEFSSIRCHN